MAKSLRSKSRRKNKQFKRIRYGKKELTALMTVVDKDRSEVVIKDAAEVVRSNLVAPKLSNPDAMEVSDPNKTPSKTSVKAVVKEHGTVPRWIHPRKVKRVKKIVKRANKTKKSKQ